MQDYLNLHILRMFKGSFSHDSAQIKCCNFGYLLFVCVSNMWEKVSTFYLEEILTENIVV